MQFICDGSAALLTELCLPVPPLQYDLLAGTSVAALVVPQGMSYAKSAGQPYNDSPKLEQSSTQTCKYVHNLPALHKLAPEA